MFNIFGSLKGLLKLDQVCIDNNIFRLHYKATVIILIACSLFITSNQYIGDPIDCIVEDVATRVMDTYCWIYSTYTLPEHKNGDIGRNIIQPGIGGRTNDKQPVKYHKYYQWVCFALFFQAVFFYFPRCLWKQWEGERIKMLAQNLNTPILRKEFKAERKKAIIEYFKKNLGRHNFYALRFFFCELLNFINVIGQIFFMDYFLDAEFTTYGIDVLRLTEQNPETRTDVMASVFPEVAKCVFYKYGPSGSIENIDGLCILPLNIINEKIYVFLWFWFLMLSILSAFALIHRIIVLMVPQLRLFAFYTRLSGTTIKSVKDLMSHCKMGDWFILLQLSKNIDVSIFEEIVDELNQIYCNPL